MIGKRISQNYIRLFIITVFLLLSRHLLFPDNTKQSGSRLDKAVARIKAIRALPEMKYLHTLDGQNVF